MVRTLLVRGMLVGLVAGLLSLGFAAVVGEPQIDRAIAFEEQEATLTGEAHESEPISRTVQKTLGLAAGVALYGVAFGGLFGLVFAVADGRLGQLSPRTTAVLLALAGFVAIVLVPFLKYPANPPAVGDPETIQRRTELYVAMVLASVGTMVLAVRFGQWLMPRVGMWNAALLATGAFVVAVTVIGLALPAVNEVPTEFPATVIWRFRLASLGTQLVMWTTLGLLFGTLTERSRRPAHHVRGQPARAGA